jgi:sigma-B regulation protein RsbU (phosphoserine phosphatase)
MVVPLTYSGNCMGVLAVVNPAKNGGFSASDMEVFQTIAEQSAFALFNANIYSEASEKRRIDSDLQIARDIQRILLPSTAPDVPGFQICGINIPARYVSGDYYDYVKISEHAHGVVIADVSGKGVPASLIMAMCRSVLRSQAPQNDSASDVLKEVNRQLFPDIKEDMFISMAYLILDQDSDEVVISRAGHDPPLLYRAEDGSMHKVNPPGMAVGIDMGTVFDRINHDHRLNLKSGDCIVLYTDGVTEAVNDIGTEYGTQKMMQKVQQSAGEGAQAIIKTLTDDLREFVGDHPQSDDITLIAIRKV